MMVSLLFVCAIAGCRRTRGSGSTAGGSTIVAIVDGHSITTEDLTPPGASSSRNATAADKRRFLDSIIRFEVMASEAASRGYDKNPEVIRATKQAMISELINHEIPSRPEVPEASIQQYYADHPDQFRLPEQIRIRQIVAADGSGAAAAFAAASALRPGDERGFEDLVVRYSQDAASKAAGGDVGWIDRATRLVPKPIVDAAFSIKNVNDMIGPIATERGFYVVQLIARRPASSRSLADVRTQIQQRLAGEARARKMDDWTAQVLAKHKVEIFEQRLNEAD